PKRGSERHTRRRLAGIEHHERKARTAHEQVGRSQGHLAAATTAHPEHTREHDTGTNGRRWIERGVGIDECGRAAGDGDIAQAREHQTRAPRRQLTDDLGDRARAYPRTRHDWSEAKHELSTSQDPQIVW